MSVRSVRKGGASPQAAPVFFFGLAFSAGLLDAAGVPYKASVLVGPIAETIVKHATDARCDLVCIGSRGMSELGKALLGSTVTKVLHLATLPLLIVK